GFFCVWRGNGRLLTTHCGHQTHRSTLMIGGLMSVAWRDIAFQLEPDVAREVAKAWSWLIPEPWEPIVCSTVAGVFLEKPNGEVHWLDTGTGLVEQVASTRAQFEEVIRSSPDLVDEWFLPPLVERLHAAG